MSLYQLQKLINHVNRDAAQRERYREDPAAFIKNYELTDAETRAALDVDVRALYRMGVHSLLLRPFTLLHKLSNEDYAKALRDLECHADCLRLCCQPCSGNDRMDGSRA